MTLNANPTILLEGAGIGKSKVTVDMEKRDQESEGKGVLFNSVRSGYNFPGLPFNTHMKICTASYKLRKTSENNLEDQRSRNYPTSVLRWSTNMLMTRAKVSRS